MKFWRSHKENDSKVTWVSRKIMGLSKARDRLGYKDLESFNCEAIREY